MISFLRGEIAEKTPAYVVLDVGGVGYEVFVPLSTYDGLPPAGQRCTLLIHDYHREDAHLLYGFLTPAERELFLLLLNVSGIGAKTAIATLSGMSIPQLKTAIAGKDPKRLSKIPGIGKKTAERIVVELSDKINPLDALGSGPANPLDAAMRDAVSALCTLGKSPDEALRRVREIADGPNPPKDAQSFIRLALSK